MSEVITFHALDLSGETGLKLYLRKSDGSLLNTDGDTFTEPATGMFQTTLTESRSGLGSLAVRVCDGTETADNLLYDGFLAEGSTVIGATVELDSTARVKLAAEQPDCSVLRTGVEYQHTQNSAGDDTVNVTIEEA